MAESVSLWVSKQLICDCNCIFLWNVNCVLLSPHAPIRKWLICKKPVIVCKLLFCLHRTTPWGGVGWGGAWARSKGATRASSWDQSTSWCFSGWLRGKPFFQEETGKQDTMLKGEVKGFFSSFLCVCVSSIVLLFSWFSSFFYATYHVPNSVTKASSSPPHSSLSYIQK